jgi:predicted small integral membrane protein
MVRVVRLVQVLLVASIGFYGALVAFGNVADYGSNFAFVQHVMTMDTVFEANRGSYRAIAAPWAHHAAYAAIIATEAAVGLLCITGAIHLLRGIDRDQAAFHDDKGLAIVGLALGFLLWFVGFLAIGGEWFMMWQSSVWNGQEAAFRLVACLGLALLVLLHRA